MFAGYTISYELHLRVGMREKMLLLLKNRYFDNASREIFWNLKYLFGNELILFHTVMYI